MDAATGGRDNRRKASLSVEATSRMKHLPAPLTNGSIVETAGLVEVPDSNALAEWLLNRGLDTKDWGKGDTKEIGGFWKEIKLDEAGLEVWRKTDGSMQAVRVVHVLRAKVCTPENYERGIFVFNTWQEYGDGRRRTRNGLLSEKLSMSEMPLEDNLLPVCERAISEEMGCVVVAAFTASGNPEGQSVEYDPDYVSPLKVVHVKFADHTIEIEVSKSYPGLLTMYHLYTVDIVCSGMPTLDFNTLEFKEADKEGKRKLKYVHAWVWLEWSHIKRYLFEGSKLQEKKEAGSFENKEALEAWLSQFNEDISFWGKQRYKSVGDLYKELENHETHLELWNRHDGVALLMRVVHLIQLKVRSDDPRQAGKFVFQTWHQMTDGRSRLVYRFPTRKLKLTDLPLNKGTFLSAAEVTVNEELSYLIDLHHQLRPDNLPDMSKEKRANVRVRRIDFQDHRVDVEESPSFKGMCTLYHIYTAEVECEGLPLADFASFEVRYDHKVDGAAPTVRLVSALGWSWITWQQCLDMMHARHADAERKRGAMQSGWEEEHRAVKTNCNAAATSLSSTVRRLAAKAPNRETDPDVEEAERLLSVLERGIGDYLGYKETEDENPSKRLPPSMISKMAENTMPKDMVKALEGMHCQRRPFKKTQTRRKLVKL